ncbi:MAG: hypothetical protein JWR26_163, partial [Pedosphaera sp.]|nr:hypothetical protein [Pedosphaera sp.]
RSRVGFPSPPPVSFPKPDERFAIRGASGQNPCAIKGNFILARPFTDHCGYARSASLVIASAALTI